MTRYLFSPAREIPARELLRDIFRKPEMLLGRSYLTGIETLNDYYLCHFKGLADPIYYPRHMDLNELYRIAAQLLDPCHWHYYESPETPVAVDDVVVDCGAGEGLFGLSVARRCRAIYLVEPLPDYIVALKQTFSHFQNVRILPVALSDHVGQGYLVEDGTDSKLIDAKQGFAVQLMTLDSLFYDNDQPISYIKADLEGHEIQFLAGAQNTIRRYRPKIAITTYHCREHAQQITDYLKTVDPTYWTKLTGLPHHPIMLHAWVE